MVATHDDRISHLADAVVELAPNGHAVDREPEDLTLADGEVLFRQGDPGELVYVVKSGAIRLYRELTGGAEEPLEVLGAERYFGELALLLRLPRSASAAAVGATTVTSYTLRRFRRTHPTVAPEAPEVANA